MKSLEQLKQKKALTEDLKSVVKTMKSLASVNIRQYQKAVESLDLYNNTIETGFHIMMKKGPQWLVNKKQTNNGDVGAVVFGSERGMCGQFNESIVEFTNKHLEEQFKSINKQILVVGERARNIFESQSQETGEVSLPASLSDFVPAIQQIIMHIDRWQARENVTQIILFHNKPASAAGFSQNRLSLLPMDMDWLQSLKTRDWPSNTLPDFTMSWEDLFSSLVRQYFFVSLYRAMAESLASENANRLAAMQAAERNIEDSLDEIITKYNRQRQESITAELLDVVSGFEAIMKQG